MTAVPTTEPVAATPEHAAKLAALQERRRAAVRRAFTRLHPLALGCGLGVLLGLAVLAGTLVLALRGGPAVGKNLRALASYFPGYGVDVVGAFVGGAYGFAAGFLGGYAIAGFRNLALALVLGYARWSADQWRRRHLLDEV